MTRQSDQIPEGRDRSGGLDAKHAGGGDAQRQAQNTVDLRLAYARIREALERIAQGDEPRPVGKSYFPDKHVSKHDQCTHGVWMYETCGNCIAEFALSALEADHIIGLSVTGEGVADAAEIVARILAPDRAVFFKGEPTVETARRIVTALSGLSLPGRLEK